MEEKRLLIVEDNNDDAELIKATLKRGAMHFNIKVVSNRHDFITTLDSFTPDIILSDHRLPQFSCNKALEISRARIPFVPFILITGTVSDEFAASIIKEGADDYLLKNNLKRLPVAIRQAIEKKQVEKAGALLVSIINSSDDAIISLSVDGIITSWNAGAEKIFGYDASETVGTNISMIIPAERLAEEPEILARIKRGEYINHYETKRRKKDGNEIDISLTVSPIKDSRGNIIGASKIARDITERIERDIQKSFDRNNLFALINNTNDLMWSVDKNLKIITFNDAFNKTIEFMSGKPLAKGQDILSTQFTEDQRRRYEKHYKRALAGEIFTIVDKFESSVEVWAEISFYPIRHDAIVIGTACFSRDISERVRAEKELKKSFEEIRQLASHLQNVREEERIHIAREIHDELGQQLTGLKMDVHSLDKYLTSQQQEHETKEKLKDIIDLTDEIVKSVRRISTNLRPSILDDLGLVAALEWQGQEVEKRSAIQVKFVCSDEKIDLPLNIATGIFRVYQEALNNAVKHANAHKITSRLTVVDKILVLEIADDGKGIDEQQPGKKTFGLLGIKERVHIMRGKFELTSEKNEGTQLYITIPLS